MHIAISYDLASYRMKSRVGKEHRLRNAVHDAGSPSPCNFRCVRGSSIETSGTNSEPSSLLTDRRNGVHHMTAYPLLGFTASRRNCCNGYHAAHLPPKRKPSFLRALIT